jgi:tetratricopeptide (TPR) repeat protein
MSHALKIVTDTLLSVLVLAFVVWLFYRALKRSEDPPKLIFKWIVTAVVVGCAFLVVGPMMRAGGYSGAFIGVPLAAVCGLAMAITWRHSIIDLIANPIGSLFDGGKEEVEPKPYYSIAITKRKRGHPLEAIVVIREQLAKFPNDFEGVLLLAHIQAEDMNDLPGAEITLDNFCASSGAHPRQISAAWTRLADWHLKIGVDVDSARAALEKIIARFPETELSLHAEQRIAHLGGAEKILLGQHDRQQMVLPEGVKNIGLLDSTEFLQPTEIEPGKLAAAHVKHLEAHPHDSEVREKLAMIYARDFKRLDLATLELNQLINESRHGPKQIANWLNLLANFQIELGADVATVRATLEQIVERFPNLSVAEIAQRRLAHVQSELNGKKETSSVKLGVYEQNIGLKYGMPRKDS